MPTRESQVEERERRRRGGDWLRSERERRGWTTRSFGDRLGLSNTQITNYENGARVPDERVPAIATAFGMSVMDVRRALGLWVPDGLEPRLVTPEEAIRADQSLRPDQQAMLLAALASARGQPLPPYSPDEALSSPASQ